MSTRDQHLKALRQLVKSVRKLDGKVDEKFAAWANRHSSKAARDRAANFSSTLPSTLRTLLHTSWRKALRCWSRVLILVSRTTRSKRSFGRSEMSFSARAMCSLAVNPKP